MAKLYEAYIKIACPHCLLENLIEVKAPRSFNEDPIEFQCWVGGEVQKGCLKIITVAPNITFNVLKPDWKERMMKPPEATP